MDSHANPMKTKMRCNNKSNYIYIIKSKYKRKRNTNNTSNSYSSIYRRRKG